MTWGIRKRIVALAIIAAFVALVIGAILMFTNVIVPPTPPTLTVTYIGVAEKTNFPGLSQNVTQYDFNVKTTEPSSLNRPFGPKATSETINSALAPLLNKYDLVKGYYPNATATWTNEYLFDGVSLFSLFANTPFSDSQINSLTQDLQNALRTTQ